MPENNGPVIQPANINAAGIPAQLVAWVDPSKFPHGVELVLSAPGSLRILGHLLLAPGASLAVVPPAYGPAVKAQARLTAPGPGQIAPPGLG